MRRWRLEEYSGVMDCGEPRALTEASYQFKENSLNGGYFAMKALNMKTKTKPPPPS